MFQAFSLPKATIAAPVEDITLLQHSCCWCWYCTGAPQRHVPHQDTPFDMIINSRPRTNKTPYWYRRVGAEASETSVTKIVE